MTVFQKYSKGMKTTKFKQRIYRCFTTYFCSNVHLFHAKHKIEEAQDKTVQKLVFLPK